MGRKIYGWRTFTGAGLLLILVITVFFPVIKLSEDIPSIALLFARWVIKADSYAVLRWWGILIYLPILLAFGVMIFELVTGRACAVCLIVTGAVSAVCENIVYFAIPSGLIRIVDDDSMKETVRQLVKHGDSIVRFIVFMTMSVILITYGILLLTAFRIKKYDTGNDTIDISINSIGVWNEENVHKYSQYGRIKGIKGQYSGQVIEISSGEEIVFGRDPRFCMLIFDSPKISRRHCAISYDAAKGCYRMIDYSANGTKLSNGVQLSASTYTMVQSGTDIYLNKGEEIFRLL